MTDARFELCLPFILKEEGGNSDDPQDHGGRTSRGIIQREYDKWRTAKGEATQDVFKASDQEVHDIYYNKYWLPVCPQLTPGVDLVYFNIAVNGGTREATILLQRTLDIAEDSTEFKSGHEFVGPLTLKYAGAMLPSMLINSFSDNILKFYRSLKQFPRYGNNWTGRTARIRAVALKMNTVPQPKKEVTMPDTPVVAVQMHDPIPEIIAVLEGVKKFVPFLSGLPFLPPGVVIGANAAIPIIEEVLQMIEAFNAKSGVDLFQTIGQHIQTIGSQVQTVTAAVAHAPAPVKSEGMPNAQ